MDYESRIKLFGMSHSQMESDLNKVEKNLHVDLQRGEIDEREDEYYPQFDLSLRTEAKEMGRHYELFYCLEKSIRKLISETLESAKGGNWWNTCVPEKIKTNVANNINNELDSGVTLRSDEELDYVTFGELGEIVRSNWISFDAIFSNQKAFSKIMTSLNILRGPIAHCSFLAEDEVLRLKLTVRDWFRLME